MFEFLTLFRVVVVIIQPDKIFTVTTYQEYEICCVCKSFKNLGPKSFLKISSRDTLPVTPQHSLISKTVDLKLSVILAYKFVTAYKR
jgi:hypothetical protein